MPRASGHEDDQPRDSSTLESSAPDANFKVTATGKAASALMATRLLKFAELQNELLVGAQSRKEDLLKLFASASLASGWKGQQRAAVSQLVRQLEQVEESWKTVFRSRGMIQLLSQQNEQFVKAMRQPAIGATERFLAVANPFKTLLEQQQRIEPMLATLQGNKAAWRTISEVALRYRDMAVALDSGYVATSPDAPEDVLEPVGKLVTDIAEQLRTEPPGGVLELPDSHKSVPSGPRLSAEKLWVGFSRSERVAFVLAAFILATVVVCMVQGIAQPESFDPARVLTTEAVDLWRTLWAAFILVAIRQRPRSD
jgi:hypothetical protein